MLEELWGSLFAQVLGTGRWGHEHLGPIHPESALAAYLEGANGPTNHPAGPVVLPFESNADQRDAVVKALRNRVSVIDGPPGTGKTETILNLIANILLVPGQTVAVVSASNSAVDNVKEKLDASGLGFVAARLGRKELVEQFLKDQDRRNEKLSSWLTQAPTVSASGTFVTRSFSPRQGFGAVEGPDASIQAQVEASESRLVSIWGTRRELAKARSQIRAYELEAAHFERRTSDSQLADLEELPLLRKSSHRILDYLAETTVIPELPGGLAGLVGRLRRYLRYGRLKGIDPRDAEVFCRLQQAFYTHRLQELQDESRKLEASLEQQDHREARTQHRRLSRQLLEATLHERYQHPRLRLGAGSSNRLRYHTRALLRDYPLVLTTCHSICSNLAEGTLLNWLIIDEATQTDLLSAALALSHARNVVVVGDLKQLGHIVPRSLSKVAPPAPVAAYDVMSQSVLSSVTEVYGSRLPRTILREHFRCAPEIIEFFNQMFYDGELVPLSESRSDGVPALLVHKTAPGNHHRQVTRGAQTGRYNQREIDGVHEILDDVLEAYGIQEPDGSRPGAGDIDTGITTPYRLQATKTSEALGHRARADQGRWMAETVHKFQGRGSRVMVLSTVIDSSWQAQLGLSFVDDPRLVNVAVSRAKDHFVLVTHHSELPRSKTIKALIGYIRFHAPQQVLESRTVSVFDLLYKEYSHRLAAFASRVHGPSKYKSENIVWTLLEDILAEPGLELLEVLPQVRLRDLVPVTDLLDDRQKRFVRSSCAVDFVV